MKYLPLLLFVLPIAARAQEKPVTEPIRFRDAYIGQAVSDWADCSSGKAKALKDGYKGHGKLCEGNGILAKVKYHTRVLSGNDPAEEGEILFFAGGRLTRIKIFIPDEREWEKVKYDITQKLGDPVSEAPQVYQNAFGARWEYDQGFWLHGDIVAYAGIKASALTHRTFGNAPATGGIEVTITDAQSAKLKEKMPSTMD